ILPAEGRSLEGRVAETSLRARGNRNKSRPSSPDNWLRPGSSPRRPLGRGPVSTAVGDATRERGQRSAPGSRGNTGGRASSGPPSRPALARKPRGSWPPGSTPASAKPSTTCRGWRGGAALLQYEG